MMEKVTIWIFLLIGGQSLDAKEDFDNTSPSFIIPFFVAYLFLGIQTIFAIIKRKRTGKEYWQQEQDFFASHYWDDELNDWVEKKEIEK